MSSQGTPLQRLISELQRVEDQSHPLGYVGFNQVKGIQMTGGVIVTSHSVLSSEVRNEVTIVTVKWPV